MFLVRGGTRRFPHRARTKTTKSKDSVAVAKAVGDRGVLFRFGSDIDESVNDRAVGFMRALNDENGEKEGQKRPEGVQDVLPAYASVLVHYDPLKISFQDVHEWCLSRGGGVETMGNNSGPSSSLSGASYDDNVIEIPVRYGGEFGPDVDDATRVANLASSDELVRLHSEAIYRVYFLGFTGGFPYLGGLDSRLAAVPRLSTPRQAVPKGAVGIAAGQTGVYTLETPGGWHVIGRTDATLFDPTKDPPAALGPGDVVRFVPVNDEDVMEQEGNDGVVTENAAASGDGDASERLSSAEPTKKPWVEVIKSGPLTTVQDLGRYGYAHHGVSRSGACDALALRMGNALLGNKENAAGLEIAMGGARMKCHAPCAVTLTGADCSATLARGLLPDAPAEKIRVNEVVHMRSGDELELGFAKDGARAYVCVQGGVDSPNVLGSRSTDLRAGLGDPAIRGGDLLFRRKGDDGDDDHVAPIRSAHDPLREERARGEWRLRILPGPGDPDIKDKGDDDDDDLLQSLVTAADPFSVSPRADRMACVLNPPKSVELTGGQQLSEPCVSGTVQVPMDGHPVILMSEAQTTGGYRVGGVVIEADLWKVAQMRPGDSLRFERTTPDDAVSALRSQRDRILATEPRLATDNDIDMRRLTSGVNQMVQERRGGGDGEDGNTFSADDYWSAILEYSEGNMMGARRATARMPRSDAHTISLNADCGEGFDDARLLEYVTCANVACGGHAGTPASVARTVELAAAASVVVGAHPSFPDRENFGRVAMSMERDEIRDQVLWQVGALDALCRAQGISVSYIKPHGALYHAVMGGGPAADAIAEAALALDLPLLLMPTSSHATYGEGFAERAYDGDSLRSRDRPGAVINEPDRAAEQAVALASDLRIHSICVHGDSPNAVAVAKAVRTGLTDAGFALRSFASPS
eukprot:g737.t1